MNILDKIYIAQRNAGEAAVIANLERNGLVTTDAETITRLQGEAAVMVGLLTEAVAVLQTIDPESASEDESLSQLRSDIWAVLTAVAKRSGA